MAGSKSDTGRRLRCSTCGLLKARSDFHARSNRARGASSKCKSCERVRQIARRDRDDGYGQRHYEANRARYAELHLLRTYGLTQEQYDLLWRAQGGLCACCRQPERALNKRGEIRQLAVDHDHQCCPSKKSCGKCIRGLLCQACNVGLGAFGDSPELLQAAIQYMAVGKRLRLVEGG